MGHSVRAGYLYCAATDIAMLNLARGLETTLEAGLPPTFADLVREFRRRIASWVKEFLSASMASLIQRMSPL